MNVTTKSNVINVIVGTLLILINYVPSAWINVLHVSLKLIVQFAIQIATMMGKLTNVLIVRLN